MIAPHPANFIEQRLGRMTMQRGEFDGEIRGNKNARQGGKGKTQKQELPNGGAVTKLHQPRIIPRRAHQGDNGLR